ncbi:hypothetical protein AWZ03_008220 [Drosophila navojoa]|uniref:Uncharacterized protein n=1 Tax=Drosophila navojoa TaxID=7232 RepID=A0A484BAN0_DRONA|nr:uncharacterized protein LOC108650666 [Drosophila navojoa]TDG45362.1 hypothetical protein AWZ03_008220 [Drosophila navojoa]
MTEHQEDLLSNDDDESFSYCPEVEDTFTEEETEQALLFIKENNLPMADLHYALKYVRISNRAVDLDDKFKEIQQRLKKLREQDMVVVSPPKCGNLSYNFVNNPQT